MKNYSIKKKFEFEQVIKEGKKIINSCFIIYYLPSLFFNDEKTKIGIAVGKKITKANKRNYQKRIIRDILTQNQNYIPKNCYIVIISRPKIMDSNYKFKEEKLISLLRGVK